MVMLQLRQLVVHPGQRVQLQEVNWSEFEAILDELGDQRASRIAYNDGILEIRMPLPKHEKAKVLIGDMVKILLEELDIDNECFGSSTLKRQDMAKGIEPDDCFYIENSAQMIGKDRIDLAVDPPPDLAIEVDVTSKTELDVYSALGIRELWRFKDGTLQISLFQNGQYSDSTVSLHFPDFPIIDLISEFLEQAQTAGRSQTLKSFRQRVRAMISTSSSK
ncbi:MAG: Uma2 family endonuclease [Myxacorys californica WJT36-NPBG1]|jgi:Uma2 family endonuclease|nr:Uma2 family endonuclease [Myxacorys californica WJT36-NPBG1]